MGGGPCCPRWFLTRSPWARGRAPFGRMPSWIRMVPGPRLPWPRRRS
ncbi:hypothetical protein ACFYOA_09550 [Streptomyces iakyrus]